MSFFKKIQIILISLICVCGGSLFATSPFADIESMPGWSDLPEDMKREMRALQQLPPEEQEKILREAERMAETVSKMTPEEQEKLLRDVERIQKIVDEVGEDALNRMSPDELNDFFEKALAQEDMPSSVAQPAPDTKAPAPQAATMSTSNADLQQFLQFIRILARHIDSFLLKADNILELHSKVERWSRKGTLRSWGSDATFNSVMNGIRSFNSRIHELADPHTNQGYVQDVYKNEVLKNTLLNLYTALSTYERQIDANMFGMGDLGDTARDAVLRILETLGSSIKQHNIEAQFNTLKDAYKTADEKAREAQLGLQKKAEDASKKPVRPKTATIAGTPYVDDAYAPSYKDYGSGYNSGGYYSPDYSSPSSSSGASTSSEKKADAKKSVKSKAGAAEKAAEKKGDGDADKKKSGGKKEEEKKEKDPLDELMDPLKKSCETVRKELKKVANWNLFLTSPTEVANVDPAPDALKKAGKALNAFREQLLALYRLKSENKDDLKAIKKKAQGLLGSFAAEFKVLTDAFQKTQDTTPKTITKKASRLKYITGPGTETVQGLMSTKKSLEGMIKDFDDTKKMAAYLPKPAAPVAPVVAPAAPGAPAPTAPAASAPVENTAPSAPLRDADVEAAPAPSAPPADQVLEEDVVSAPAEPNQSPLVSPDQQLLQEANRYVYPAGLGGQPDLR